MKQELLDDAAAALRERLSGLAVAIVADPKHAGAAAQVAQELLDLYAAEAEVDAAFGRLFAQMQAVEQLLAEKNSTPVIVQAFQTLLGVQAALGRGREQLSAIRAQRGEVANEETVAALAGVAADMDSLKVGADELKDVLEQADPKEAGEIAVDLGVRGK